MAGPAAQVIFSTAVAPGWQAALDDVVETVRSGDREGAYFWVGTTRPIGGHYEGEGRPFALDVGSELPWEVGALAEVGGSPAFYERPFGFRPDIAVTLIAMCNGTEDHRILGELALAAAERLSGVIDMAGLIVPHEVPLEERLQAPWPAFRSRVEAFTSALPGKAVAIPYPVPSGREWAAHTVDAEFLRAWLHHPEFYMIK